MNNDTDTIIPPIGILATYTIGSDRYAGTITEIKHNGRTMIFKFKNFKRTEEFTLREGGAYYAKGSNCGYLIIGIAIDYRDPSF